MRAPPLSFNPRMGAPTFIAVSMIFTILFACISPKLPPKTVKSWENTNTVRPSIVPWPVRTPSPGIRFLSMPNSAVRCSTNASVSTKEPRSKSSSTRSFAVSLPFARCASMRSFPPPSLARAFRWRNSATRSSSAMTAPNAGRVFNPSRSGLFQDLKGAFDKLVALSLLIHDNQGTVCGDVVGPTCHRAFRGRSPNGLPDRRTLSAVFFQEELEACVAIPRVDVVHLVQKVVEELVVRDEETYLPLDRRGLRLHVGWQLLEVHIRVHADPDDDVIGLVPVNPLGENAGDLAVLVDRVVRVLQSRKDAEMAQGLDDGHADQHAEDPSVCLFRAEDCGHVKTSERRGPRTSLAAATGDLTIRPDDEALFNVRLEEFLRRLVRRLDDVEVADRSSNDFSIRLVELAQVQRRTDPWAAISTFLVHEETCTAAGALTLARSWLARNPRNITAIPASSPM